MANLYQNLLRGVGYIMDIAPKKKRRTMKTIYYRPYKNDFEAIKSDWERIGYTIKKVIDKEVRNHASKTQS